MTTLFGIRDFKELFGKDFDLDEYKKIQFAYFVGELEAKNPAWERDKEGKDIERNENGDRTNFSQIIPPMHDMSYYPRSIDTQRAKYQRQILGEDLSERHQKCIEYYEQNGYAITSKIYRGTEHFGIYTRSNPSFEALIRDITSFYKERKKFPEDIAGVSEISMKPQRVREQEANNPIMHE